MFSLPRQPFASHRPGEAGIGEPDDASVRSLGHTCDVVPSRVAQNPAPVLDVACAGQAKKRPVRNQPGIGVTSRLDLGFASATRAVFSAVLGTSLRLM